VLPLGRGCGAAEGEDVSAQNQPMVSAMLLYDRYNLLMISAEETYCELLSQ
jgi:hypothetical protein